MHIGEGAAARPPAREPLDARQVDQRRVEQPIPVGAVPQGVVDPPIVGSEGSEAAAEAEDLPSP